MCLNLAFVWEIHTFTCLVRNTSIDIMQDLALEIFTPQKVNMKSILLSFQQTNKQTMWILGIPTSHRKKQKNKKKPNIYLYSKRERINS